MIDATTFTRDMLSNPSQMGAAVINAMEASDSGEEFTITDPNNGFVMQLLASLAIFSKFSEKIDYTASFFYPQRARNAEQLYPHLSEFDYIDLMASPATVPFIFAMSKDWIIQNAKYYDSNYNKIEIPATSYFTMGGITYSMYYPIEILVNRNTGAVTAFYNTDTQNSLNTLSTNMLLNVQEFTQNGINYFQITFNMYQFDRKSYPDTVSSLQGYIKTFSYSDQFYAAKIYTKQNGVWTELKYSLSSLYYDYQTPTAILSILNDSSKIRIEIPQIYFDDGKISQDILVELYTTKGSVNYSLSAADVAGVTANFDTRSSVFAAPLDQMPTWTIVPTTTEVEGGSDVKTYDEIRDDIVNQRLYNRVAVTTPEIIEAGKKAGFDLTRVTDDLTERVYFASNILADSNDIVLPTFAGNIYIAEDSLIGNPSSIVNYSDGYITILPTTTFSISNNGLTCVPLTDGQVDVMSKMASVDLAAELNKGIYVRQPFHITLQTVAKSPQALIYNLLSPTMTSLQFIAENAHSAPQMSANGCSISHLGHGTGGYQIILGMVRSSNIARENPARFLVLLTCISKSGKYIYLPASYQTVDDYGVESWAIQLNTSYHITTDDYISVYMQGDDDEITLQEISLHQTFTLVTAFVGSLDSSVPVDQTLNSLLPPSAQSTYIAMAYQSMTLALGSNLSSQIYCGVNTSWGNDVYKTAEETLYYTTNIPVFQTDEKGIVNTRINPTTKNVEVVIVYPQDSVPSSTDDLVYSVTNSVAVAKGTTTDYPVESTKGLLVGMGARGTNIPPDSYITFIGNNVITLSKPTTQNVAKGTQIVFTNSSSLLRTSLAQQSASASVTVADTSNLIPGQSVFGFDIPKNTKIISVDSKTQITLSSPSSAALPVNSLLTIINTTAPGVIKVKAGDIVTDPTGKPIIVKDAQNQYLIPAILFDGRLFASDDPSDQAVIKTISQRLQTYANQIATIDAGLIEDSNVYYKPARTMGYATFGIGGGKTISMSLELSFSFTVYVDIAAYNTQTLLSTMTDAIVRIVNSALQNPIISVSDITTTIVKTLGSNVSAVEGGDISGISGLRLISLENPGTTPSIENRLSVQADGSVTRSPNIQITYLPKPDTTETTSFAS